MEPGDGQGRDGENWGRVPAAIEQNGKVAKVHERNFYECLSE